jgi:putative membrane protein
MRKILIASVLIAALVPAAAQQPANPDARTPAVNTPNSPPNPGAPAAGANSFTEGQAKSRIEARGFTNVSALQKDDAGVWRGTATRGGAQVAVSVDFQGNVLPQ